MFYEINPKYLEDDKLTWADIEYIRRVEVINKPYLNQVAKRAEKKHKLKLLFTLQNQWKIDLTN